MKAKDKAIELTNKFYFNGIVDEDYSMEYEDAKRCALICCYEVLKTLGNIEGQGYISEEEQEWLEIKYELNKL